MPKPSLAPAIRTATPDDAVAIARLAEQLGYPATAHAIAARLRTMDEDASHTVFVAEADAAVVGWIHVFVSHSLLTDTPAEIAGLVVDENHRSAGVGQSLMDQAERWARDHGCRSVRLRSNVVRDRAHAFYERLGYRVLKTQKAFSKDLA